MQVVLAVLAGVAIGAMAHWVWSKLAPRSNVPDMREVLNALRKQADEQAQAAAERAIKATEMRIAQRLRESKQGQDDTGDLADYLERSRRPTK